MTTEHRYRWWFVIALVLQSRVPALSPNPETLPPLENGRAPQSFAEMWDGFDPRAEPLEIEILHEWQENTVTLQVVRFRIGEFKGIPARLAAVYGFPSEVRGSATRVPGLLQIHGGGQYADSRACRKNAERGYATLSIAWAGRINTPEYRVSPAEVKLFWDNKSQDPAYRLTTDWGVLDGYHAPSRNAGNAFPGVAAADWTLDDVESPRNSGWFLCALAARRALTFLEQQPEVDPARLGVYGHSMGGKLTVMTASDPRVKAAAPSCGGISDRFNRSPLFRQTLDDGVNLRQITCPIFFLSPSNDFHGRIGDLPRSVREIRSSDWRVTCSPHHNHQDSPEYEVASLLWFDQHLRKLSEVPQTPETRLLLQGADGTPLFIVRPDESRPIVAVDVYYTQHGLQEERPEDRDHTTHRFWHHIAPVREREEWTAALPLHSADKPLWVYASIRYELDTPVSGAGYYYREFTTQQFVLSSLLQTATPAELQSAGVRETLLPTPVIEDFEGDWDKHWFSYQPDDWGRSTHKLFDQTWQAPADAKLSLQVRARTPNRLVVLMDDFAAEVELSGTDAWQEIVLSPQQFRNADDEPLAGWEGVRRLRLSPRERIRPPRGSTRPVRVVGQPWQGPPPEFAELRWLVD